jgi:hypothetical protein
MIREKNGHIEGFHGSKRGIHLTKSINHLVFNPGFKLDGE